MKIEDLSMKSGEDIGEALEEFDGSVESKASPDEVLAEVDRLLEIWGLEVTAAETGDTSTAFRIKRRETR